MIKKALAAHNDMIATNDMPRRRNFSSDPQPAAKTEPRRAGDIELAKARTQYNRNTGLMREYWAAVIKRLEGKHGKAVDD